MSVDYHVHTFMCGHASGTPDEYIQRAISSGLREIGFSDHAPLPDGLREGVTMRQDEVERYIGMIDDLRREYHGKIVIRIGLEIDFPLHPSLERRFLTDTRLDYSIGSCHILGDWMFDNPECIDEYRIRDIDEIYAEYYDILEQLVRSRHFSIVGHLDLVKKFGYRPKRDFTRTIEKIIELISRDNLTVEINTAGLRNPVGEIYPADWIIQRLFDADVPVTLSSDAHRPEDIASGFSVAIEKIRAAGYRKVSGFAQRRRYDILL